MGMLNIYVNESTMYGNDSFSGWLLTQSRSDDSTPPPPTPHFGMYLPNSETKKYGMTNGSCLLAFCLLFVLM